MGLFGRMKPVSEVELAYLEKDLSSFKKLFYIMELEGEVCSLDPEFNNNGNLRKNISRIKKIYNSDIFMETCNCDFKQKAPLTKSGVPRVHKKYVKEWAS